MRGKEPDGKRNRKREIHNVNSFVNNKKVNIGLLGKTGPFALM